MTTTATGALLSDSQKMLRILSSLISTKIDPQVTHAEYMRMQGYCQRVGLTREEMSKLRIVHVAGTKGKGSTCAMVESMLRHCGYKTGLYTSPHLVDVRERMRMNGVMVSKELFEHHFWDCYARLKSTESPEAGLPRYTHFITLMAFKLYIAQAVDALVLEVHVGGRQDATNVVAEPVACGITSLGLDHMELLGDTLPKIAREKAGILKPGRPGFTVQQAPEALQALQDVAASVGAPLTVTDLINRWKPADGSSSIQLSLGGAHQLQNAGLAVQLCQAFEQDGLNKGTAKPGAAERLAALQQGMLPVEYMQGLANTSWPGRSQIVQDEEFWLGPPVNDTQLSRLSFFIDGAHTTESLAACADWFGNAANDQPQPPGMCTERVLLFNCVNKRDPLKLLPILAQGLASRGISMQHVLFVPSDSQLGTLSSTKSRSSSPPSPPDAANGTPTYVVPPAQVPDLSWQLQLQQVWQETCLAACGPGAGAAPGAQGPTAPPLPPIAGLPPQTTLPSGIAPSLGSAVCWLREVVRGRPQLRLQVLVTGSLYLVGDVLRLLGKAPK